jgi:hypothetical protein
MFSELYSKFVQKRMWSSCKTCAFFVLFLTSNGKCQQILVRLSKNKIYENPPHRVIAKHSKRQCYSPDIKSHTHLMFWSYETALLSNCGAANMLVKASKVTLVQRLKYGRIADLFIGG